MQIEHTDKGYEKELVGLKDAILTTGVILEEMIADAQSALVNRDDNLASEVIKKDRQVDRLEMEIQKRCTDILALRQPAAFDLRFIILGLRIATDLERIGDSTKNVCNGIKKLNKAAVFKEYIELPKMFQEAGQMLHDTIEAFIKLDVTKAEEIRKRDDLVDDYQRKIIRNLIELMCKDPQIIEPATILINVTQKIERLADHASNIAEEVIYLAEGKNVRHQP